MGTCSGSNRHMHRFEPNSACKLTGLPEHVVVHLSC